MVGTRQGGRSCSPPRHLVPLLLRVGQPGGAVPPSLPAHSQGLTGRWLKANLVELQGGGDVGQRAGGRDAGSYHRPTNLPSALRDPIATNHKEMFV